MSSSGRDPPFRSDPSNLIVPSFTGTLVPDENGSHEPLGRYRDKTLVVVLPGDLTVFDIRE